MDNLPTDYDAIVVGTGMTESIIAAALSRIGKSVLHLDFNEYYGENWASFNLEGIKTWIDNKVDIENEGSDLGQYISNEETIVETKLRPTVWNVSEKWYCNESNKNEEDEEELITEKSKKSVNWTSDKIKNEYRKFNLDLCPKMLFSKGPLVRLLISSNIARYAEFKSVNRVLTWRDGLLEPVPCSRADVFATKNVSVVQKRMLVKVLTLFTEYPENINEFEGFENKTFLEYLKHKKLPLNLIHYILYAIAMGTNSTPCIEGVKTAKAFLESLGIHGNTPFIFPLYGSGELPQCFCRLCAVFGGVYHLKRGTDALIVKDNKCVGVISGKQRLKANHVVLSSSCAPKEYLTETGYEDITRGIFITDKSILKSEREPLTLLQFPTTDNSVTVIELGSETHACPQNLFVVHMTTRKCEDSNSDLKPVVDALFRTCEQDDDNRPNILWSLTWNSSQGSDKSSQNSPVNVKICSGPDLKQDFDFAIAQAKRIFEEMYPQEEFLPRAPDPEEIVLDDPDESSTPRQSTEDKKEAESSEQLKESLPEREETNQENFSNENNPGCDQVSENSDT